MPKLLDLKRSHGIIAGMTSKRRRRIARQTIDGETTEYVSAEEERRFNQMDREDAARDATGAIDLSQMIGLSEIKRAPLGGSSE